MGSSMDKPAAGTCPLCLRECRNHVTLGCRHRFCQGCIGELWSGSATGPYYCPECKYEYTELPDLGDSALGKRLSARYSSKKVLGKRKFSSSTFRYGSEGYRLGTGPSNNSPIVVSDPDLDTPPAKKKATGAPSSEAHGKHSMSKTSSTDTTHLANSSQSKERTASVGEPSWRGGEVGESSSSAVERPPQKSASPAGTCTQEPSSNAKGSPSSRREQLGQNNSSSDSAKTSNASTGGSVLCHYCSSREQRAAVKTCLVCGASMCPEHLRVHLESPVFQSHPLVPAVEDVSPWRCQEHQEMNRIYCRPCGVCVCTVCTVIGSHKDHACISIREAEKVLRATLSNEMKKIQIKETAVSERLTELTERKNCVQEVVEGTRAAVVQQYQAMREALELEEQQALLCVAQEESRVLGSIDEQLSTLNDGLRTIQTTFNSLQRLADAEGASRAQDQAFIMEYRKMAEGLNSLSDPVQNLDPVEELNQGRLDCLQDWTERRLDIVVISVPHRDPFRLLYGFCPNLNPDTAHPKLLLSAENRHVEYSESQQPYPDHEARFSIFPQVLGSKALSQGRHYWEVEVSLDEGRWKVGVCDGQIVRKGQKDSCRIGFYTKSWCLVCEKGRVEALHDKVTSPVCATGLQKVGVLVDFEEGCLSFYSVSDGGALTLLYSFQQEFSEPLYPALAVSKTRLSVCDLFARPGTD
ncbi:tripartite motif-containing protein 14 isoform X2 [Astyanax mexicanus]|uniref:tripartite motif-containing protein 14 isoform X2 n=1 Tax=Astyanax mexicanus TaxID=7994 RepID=UPI0020CB351C|nr:tripartite motif-containing protein 14 isoform X2 [Astyanax mexicanus]